MANATTYKQNFARVLKCTGQRVELAYDLDTGLWPWLGLAPHHPVVVEKYQYFGAMTASWAQKLFAPEVFTALTRFSWQCTPVAFRGQYATRGICETRTAQADTGFTLSVSNAASEPLYLTQGEGFVFHDRDYTAWRERTRSRALQSKDRLCGRPVPPESAGLGSGGRSFISSSGDATAVQALVPRQGGFAPEHPFHTGSGDHVNAAQLMDCGLQTAHWLVGNGSAWKQPLVCTGGSAQFHRYVELDVPFWISCTHSGEPDAGMQFDFSQAGRDNVRLTLKFDSACPLI